MIIPAVLVLFGIAMIFSGSWIIGFILLFVAGGMIED